MDSFKPCIKFDDRSSKAFRSPLFEAFLEMYSHATGLYLSVFNFFGEQLTPVFGLPGCCEICCGHADGFCGDFHRCLAGKAVEQSGTALDVCPLGIGCFAFSVGRNERDGFVLCGGGFRIMGASLPEIAAASDIPTSWERLPRVTKKDFSDLIGVFVSRIASLDFEISRIYNPVTKLQYSSFRRQLTEMGGTPPMDRVLQAASEDVKNTFGLDFCFFMLSDMRGRLSLLFPDEEIRKFNFVLTFDRGLLSRIVRRDGTGIFQRKELTPLLYEGEKAPEVLAAVPLLREKTFLGYMFLGNSEKERHFSSYEKQYLTLLAAEIAGAALAYREYERKKQEDEELRRSREELGNRFSQIGTALSSALNLQQLLRVIVDIAIRLIGAESGSLHLIEDRRLSMQVHVGPEVREIPSARLKMRESLVGWDGSFSQGTSGLQTSSDSEIYYKQAPLSEEVKTYLGVPILVKYELIGVLNIYSQDGSPFAPEKIELLAAFVKQAALAIDNARNYEKEQKRAREAALLYEGARAIGQTFALDELLRVTVNKLLQIVKVDRCVIFLYDEDGDCFRASAYSGISAAQRSRLKEISVSLEDIDEDILQDLTCGRPRVLSGSSDDTSGFTHRLSSVFSYASALLSPLIAREKLLGIVYLDDSQIAHYFSGYQIRLVMTLSVQIAVAIQRARLLAKQEEQTSHLRSLLQISSILPSSLSLTRVAKLIRDKARTIHGVDASALILTDEDEGGSLELQWIQNMNEDSDTKEVQIAVAHRVLREKRALSADSRSEDPLSAQLQASGFGQVFSVPLVAKRRTLGVLNFFSSAGKTFSAGQKRFLRNYANQASIALENARLYAVVSNKVRELATLFEVGKAVNSSIEFNKVMELISSNFMRVMDSDAISIMQLDDREEELYIHTSRGLSKELRNRRIPVDSYGINLAIQTGRPVSLTQEEKEFPEELKKAGIYSCVIMPMEHRDKVGGTINLYRKTPQKYNAAEISLLYALSNQAAIALENARLYQQQYFVASILQSIVMPQKEYEFPGVEFGYVYIPSQDLSGDYFDVIPLDENRFGVVIADVSGKGHSAAIYTVRVKYLLKSYAAAGYQPSEILYRVNNLIIPETASDKFISLFYMEVDVKNRTIKYSSAGHDSPIFYSPSRKEKRLLETEGLLIGISYDAAFRQEEISFEKGDILTLYTDGVTEAMDVERNVFGMERLTDIIQRNCTLAPQILANRIYTTVQKYTRRHLHDDFSLFVMRL